VVMAGSGEERRTATVTVLFCDLVGSTERQARLGDDAADEFRRAYFAALADAVAATHGEMVKNTGDGVMVVFRSSAVDAVTCASKMHDQVEVLDADHPARVRVGIGAGEAAFEDGDWFGTPVVEAARLCASGRDGQTLVSELVRGLVGSRGGHQFRSVGALSLKGLPAPVPAAAVIRTPIAAPPQPTAAGRRRRWPVVAVGTMAVVGLTAAGALVVASRPGRGADLPAPAGYTPRFEPIRCSSAFLAQVPNGVCGDLVVPEDRTKPGGRWMRLPVLRAPARSGSGTSDPTIGIGSDGRLEDAAKSPARDHSELIVFATRFTQNPNPAMACPEYEPVGVALLTSPPHDAALAARGTGALRACYSRLVQSGIALAHYTFDDDAGDVIDLLRALHLRRANLSAADMWSPIALAVLRDAPRVVRTLTLENPIAPGQSWATDPTSLLASVLDYYSALCRATVKCASAYPDLTALYRSDWKQLTAHPQTVVAADPDGQQRAYLVNGDSLARALAVTIGLPGNARLVAAAIAATPLNIIAAYGLGFDQHLYQRDYPSAVILSTYCSYDLYTLGLGAAGLSARTRPELSGVYDNSFSTACASWPVPKAPARVFDSVASAVPTLIVDGELYPFTSTRWTSSLQGGFPNAHTMVFATLGTSLLNEGAPPCLNDLRRQFLADPTARIDTDACTRQSPPIDFEVPTP
jgi:class 3 adenylate cyclase